MKNQTFNCQECYDKQARERVYRERRRLEWLVNRYGLQADVVLRQSGKLERLTNRMYGGSGAAATGAAVREKPDEVMKQRRKVRRVRARAAREFQREVLALVGEGAKVNA